MAVTRGLSTLKVNDRLNFATFSINTTKLQNLYNVTDLSPLTYSFTLEGGSCSTIRFIISKRTMDGSDVLTIAYYIDDDMEWRLMTDMITMAYYPQGASSSFNMGQLGKITAISTSGGYNAIVENTDCFVFSNVNRTYYGLFRRMIQWLERRHSELDYYMSLCSTAITPSFTSAKGTYNTVSDADARLIGNYLCIDFRASMTSSQQTSVGTGDITNRVMGTMTFSNFYYGPDTISTLTTNAERQNKIYGIQSYNISALSAYSTGNAHVGQWAVEASVSGHTLTVEFTLCALQGKTSQVRCICWLPVHRCPWIRES